MKKLFTLILAVCVLETGVYFAHAGSVEDNSPEDVLGRSVSITRKQCQSATTTPEYLSAGAATSTCQVYMADASEVEFRFMVNSTSTPSTLTYAYFVTEDDTPATRNWFLVDGSFDANILSTSTSELIPYRSFHKTNISASHLKLDYQITGAAADVYVEIIKPNNFR